MEILGRVLEVMHDVVDIRESAGVHKVLVGVFVATSFPAPVVPEIVGVQLGNLLPLMVSHAFRGREAFQAEP